MGEMPIKSMYSALLTPTMAPVVLYSSATSGMAERTVVLEMGARNEQ